MAASMKRNDSSSEEENEARFREAAIDSSQLFIKNYAPKQKSNKQEKPSLRPDREIIDDDDYVPNTTPGFRKHVSRKLSEIIDSQIEEVKTDVKCSCPVTESKGVKLFAGSTKFLQTEDDSVTQKHQQAKRRKKYSSSSSDSSDEEKFAEAAVSHDFIVKESRLLNEKPADVILKAADTMPQTDDLAKSDVVQNENVTETHVENQDSACNVDQNIHKPKKKKKKKDKVKD